jgi:hypothetical protein
MLRLRAAKGGLMCRYMRALEAAGLEGNGTTRRWVRCAKMRINNEFKHEVEG